MRKLFIIGLFIVFCITAFALPSLAEPPKDPDKFKFGFISCVTGPTAWLHKVWNPGAEIALEEINSDGGISGKPMEMIIEDHKSGDPKAAVSSMLKLVDMDKVPLVIVTFSPPNIACQPIAAERKVLQINFGAWSPKLVNKPYLFNSRLVGNVLAEGGAKVFWEKGYRKAAILHPNDTSGVTLKNYIKPIWEKWGGKVVAVETAELGASDFHVQVAKIRTARPDCILNYFYSTDLGYSLKQARELGVDQPVCGFIWSGTIYKAAGPASEGYFYVQDYFNPESEEEWTSRFVQKYKKNTGKDADMWGANAYEVVYIIKALIEEARKKGGNYYTGENLKEALLKIRTFPTIYEGDISFRNDGSCTKAMGLYQVKEGKGHLVGKVVLK
jgi:branched-chain amino acid transport system substrate-binding protein